MSNYDFSTLNDKDFEEIVCDLLSAEHKIIYESFKKGRDKGIDLRYSTKDNENHTVVQVKHYLNSGKSALKSKLKLEEFRKATELKVERYIVVTSIGLSPDDKSEIKSFFEPYIQTTTDIYGKDELNTLLGKHDKIETRHFKLWFNNTKVLNKIINNGVSGRSAFFSEKIRRNIGLFVKTKSFDDALNILQQEKVLLVTGIPGIGKTTLSYMLIYKLLGEEFELIYCDNNIREAEDVIEDNDSKQIFFFDDFLGDTYLEVKAGKNKKINDFILRVKSSKNKLIILTTRTTILHQAQSEHEKLERSDFDSNKFELKLEDYNTYQKANILYNHLYFNNLGKDKINSLLEGKGYNSIIDHQSYNPRLLEFITDPKKYDKETFDSYYEFCIHNLNHPEEIWKHPIKTQLNKSERLLLYVLLTLGGSYELDKLEKVYEKTNNIEDEEKGFNEVYRNLLKGYLHAEKRYKNTVVKFINPSLKDYLIDFFNNQPYRKAELLKDLQFMEQIKSISVSSRGITLSPENLVFLFDKIKNSEIKALCEISKSELNFEFCLLICRDLFRVSDSQKTKEYDTFVTQLLEDIDWSEVNKISISDLEVIIDFPEESLKYYKYIIANFHKVLSALLPVIDELNDLESLFYFQEFHDIDIFKIIEDNEMQNVYNETIQDLYQIEADDLYYMKKSEITNEQEFYSAKEELDVLKDKILEFSLNEYDDLYYDPFDKVGLGIIETQKESDPLNLKTHESSRIDEHTENIDDLFNRLK